MKGESKGGALANQSIMERKHSLLKPAPQMSPLELPRFYSSDEKLKRKNTVIQTQQRLLASPSPSNPPKETTKRMGYKYSKTEKNESPVKAGAAQLNKVNLIKEKLEEAMLRSNHLDSNKPKIHQKKVEYNEILQTQKSEALALRETNETAVEPNHNKIRYKIYKKSEVDLQLLKGFPDHSQHDLDSSPKSIRDIVRQSKAQTEECPKNPLREKSKPILMNGFVTDTPGDKRNEGKVRTVSTFQAKLARNKLTLPEKEHLKFIQDILKKTIKNSNSLDNPQTYIVCDKLKFEKRYSELIHSKHQTEYKNSLVLTRLTFYLLAHYILDSAPTKTLCPIFAKLLQAHEVITTLLIDQQQRPNQKFFSISKFPSKDLPTRHRLPSEMAVEARGNSLPRINESIRRLLSPLFTKDMPHSELFLKILKEQVSSNVQGLEEMDKVLKWEVLKMPTSPFLPQPHPGHKHYLILDLDETLIHFSPTKETHQVRPHASEFLENLSRYYQLTVFTAATRDYADGIINSIDRGGYVSHRLYRNHLTFLMGESLKDISLLGRHLQLTLIVDNLQRNFRLHPDNGILIKSWYGDQKDTILPKLQNLLVRIVLEFPDDLRKGVSLYGNYISREISERTRSFKIKYDL